MDTPPIDVLKNFRAKYESAEVAAEYQPLPPGEYICTVSESRLFDAKGTVGFKVTFVVADSPFAGRKLTYDLWLTDAAMSYTKRDLIKLGLTLDDLEKSPVIQGQFRVSAEKFTDDGGRVRARAYTFVANGKEV